MRRASVKLKKQVILAEIELQDRCICSPAIAFTRTKHIFRWLPERNTSLKSQHCTGKASRFSKTCQPFWSGVYFTETALWHLVAILITQPDVDPPSSTAVKIIKLFIKHRRMGRGEIFQGISKAFLLSAAASAVTHWNRLYLQIIELLLYLPSVLEQQKDICKHKTAPKIGLNSISTNIYLPRYKSGAR